MMTCERAQAQLNDHLDGNLTNRQQSVLMAHLNSCTKCQNEYDELVAVVHLVRQSPVADGANSRDHVMSKFRQTVNATDFAPAKPRFRMPYVPLGMAAAAVAGLTLLFIIPTVNAPEISYLQTGESGMLSALPTSMEMDRMMGQHATQSAQALAPNSEIHNETATEATALLIDVSEED